MANYDREILVPYLRDVCSIEMMEQKLRRQIKDCNRSIDNNVYFINQKMPRPSVPRQSDYKTNGDAGGSIALIIMAVISVAVGWVLSRLFDVFILFIMGIGAAVFFIGMLIADSTQEEKRQNERYLAAVQNYEKELEKIKKHDNQIPVKRAQNEKLKENRDVLLARLKRTMDIREELYSVNVIPMQYRNVYSSYYLYDYFRTSRETDLDKIIQTLLLDEIKQRLDKVIQQNESIILNQRMQLAMQEAANMQLAENHRAEMQKLAAMEKNQELQLDYQKMIVKNQLVTNFFLEADYWDKRR